MPGSVASANLTKFESPDGDEFDAKFCLLPKVEFGAAIDGKI
nr:hypothetical protein [uncultured Campylobacter sp.]